MPALAVLSPLPQFFERDGDPLDAGYLYFGVVGQNPVTSPLQVYWDAAATIPAPQPIRTVNGYPARAGSPAIIYADQSFSLLVLDKRRRQVFYAPNSADFGNAAQLQALYLQLIADISSTSNAAKGAGQIGYNASLAYAAATAGFKLKEERSLFDVMTPAQIADVQAGALGLDMSATINSAFAAAAAGKWYVRVNEGNYRVNSLITATNVPGIFGTKGKSIFTFYGPSAGDNCFVLNTDMAPFGLPYNSVLAGVTLDGTPTTGRTGMYVGTNALSGRICFRDVEIVGFKGASGTGLAIGNVVEFHSSNGLYSGSEINVGLIPGTAGLNTTCTFYKDNIREAEKSGVFINSTLNAAFVDCIIESNFQEGVRIVALPAPHYIAGVYFQRCHFENNWNGGTNQYQVVVVGNTSPLCKNIVFRDSFFDHPSATIAAISLSKVQDYIVDGLRFGTVPTNALNITSGSTGTIPNWPSTAIAFNSTTVNVDATSTAVADVAPWLSWTPAVVGLAPMTYTPFTINRSKYKLAGKSCTVSVDVTGTIGGTLGKVIQVPLPAGITSASAFAYGTVLTIDGATNEVGFVNINGTTLSVERITNYSAGAGRRITFTVTFETT